MVRYTEKQKLDAVRAYESGVGGLRAIAEAQGVSFDSLRVWVAQFRVHGAAGIVTKPRSSYDFDFKLTVVRRMNDEGLSSRQASALFKISRRDQPCRMVPPICGPRPRGLTAWLEETSIWNE